MESARELGKLLVFVGIALVVVGGFFVFGGRLPFRLGRLPGDIAYQGKNGSFLFPDRHVYRAQRRAHADRVDCESLPALKI